MKSRFDLSGRVAVVTGGNGLLGTAYAETLRSAGARVVILDIAKKLNERLQNLVKEAPDAVALVYGDVTDRESLEKALIEIEKQFGTPDILINNAAIDFDPGADASENRSFAEYSLKSWNKVIEVNLTGTMLACQVFGEAMAAAGRGSIINMSSIYGLVSPDQRLYAYLKEKTGIPFIKPIAYTATKSAIVGITKWLAVYYAPRGVRVNALAPGGVYNKQDDTFVKAYSERTPLGRMGKTEEVTDAMLFLVSDASSYVTGTVLSVDGGWTAW
jgi:NAD(P)-dependent dehydrogenase (short-subunit alcohol dehydrogenase family)